MKQFRTLDLAIEFYEEVERLPITGNMKDQLHRAASSIALNLSEGNAKSSANEKRHFFQMSYGSLRECQTILKLTRSTSAEAEKLANHLGASLYKLVNSQLKNSPNWRKQT